MEPSAGRELAPHYYRDNFLALCATVEAQYADLLAPGELLFLQRFRDLPFAAQCLYVRLVSRVGPWFRESRLVYPELGAIAPLVDSLLAAGLAQLAGALPVADLGAMYTRPELLRVFGPLPGSPPQGKAALLAAIESLALDEGELLARLAGMDGARIIAPCGAREVEVLQLLFFGNRRQGLTDFVLSDLGVARYYPYPLDRRYRLFPQREAVEEYLALAALSDGWYELRESPEPTALAALADGLLSLEVRFASSEGRWYRVCNGLGRDLERLGELDLAAQLYRRSRRHPARERRLRLMERRAGLGWRGATVRADTGRALVRGGARCGGAGAAPGAAPPGRKAAAATAGRLRPPVPRHSPGGGAGGAAGGPRAAVPLAGGALRREYADERPVRAGLLGTDFHPRCRRVPQPLPERPHRHVQPRLPGASPRRHRRAAGGPARGGHRPRAAGRVPTLCPITSAAGWTGASWIEALLAAATQIIPGAHLLAVWERMLFDPGENRRGFPDLVALGDTPGDYCLIEVKGPGDALQESQKRWLRFFEREGIPAAVAWVSWEETREEARKEGGDDRPGAAGDA